MERASAILFGLWPSGNCSIPHSLESFSLTLSCILLQQVARFFIKYINGEINLSVRDAVMDLFGGFENFQAFHNYKSGK